MVRMFAVTISSAIAISAAFAASAEVEEAVKVLQTIGNDQAKLATYCKIVDTALSGAVETADEKIQVYLKELGPEFQKAWELSGDLDPQSEDGRAHEAAMEQLDAKCD